MGVCTSRQNNVTITVEPYTKLDSHEPSPDISPKRHTKPAPAAANVTEVEIDDVQHSTQNQEDSKQCQLELLCQNTISKLIPTDKEMRDRVSKLLSAWEESYQLTAIKSQARSASAEVASDLVTLAEFLTRSNAKYLKSLDSSDSCQITIAKAFAIYFWICTNIHYNHDLWSKCVSGDLDFNSIAASSAATPEEVLNSRSSVCVGYANLFAEMAKAVGIEATVIQGDLSYVPIPALPVDKPRADTAVPHTWNAIKVQDTWLALDCTFGANYLNKSNEFKTHFTRHYFAVSPSNFILTHWPNEKDWQLLQVPITRDELEPLVIFPSCALGRGVSPHSWSRSIEIDESRHSTVIELTAKSSLKVCAKLIYMDDNAQNCQEVQSSDCLVYIQRDVDLVRVHVALPFKGSYSLLISVSQLEKKALQLPQVCLSYHLTCAVDCAHEIGYPKVYETAATAFEFKPLFWTQAPSDCICESSTGQLGLAFKAMKGMMLSHCLISGKTRNTMPTGPDAVYNYNSMIATNADSVESDLSHSLHMLKVIFPHEGWWTICLSGTKTKPNKQPQGSYTTIMSYQMYAQKGISKLTFPCVLSQQVTFMHFDPIPSVHESIEIPFTTTKPMDFQAYLSEKKPKAQELDSFVKIEKTDLATPFPNQYRLKALFPKPGNWYVHVFGRERDSPREETSTGLFSLLVDVEKPMENALAVTLNSQFTEAIQLTVANEGYISFADSGQPLVIDFKCGKANIAFQHQVLPEDPNNESPLTELPLLEHCTYLAPLNPPPCSVSPKVKKRLQNLQSPSSRSFTQHSLPVPAPDPKSMFRLTASFPWVGRWTVELFAKAPGDRDHTLAFHISLDVSQPSRGICFPKLHAGFQQLGMSIPEQFISYNPICSTSDFELPFNAPNDLQFAWNVQVNGKDEASYTRHGFVHQFGKRTPNHHFQLSFCTPGIWKAQLFASAKTNETSLQKNFMPVLEISLLVDTVDDEVAFPELTSAFFRFGLSIAKANLPFISHIQNTNTKVIIPFSSSAGVKFWHRVDRADDSVEEVNMLTKMLSNQCGQYELSLEVTQEGRFHIMLWAQPMEKVDDKWHLVLRHTVTCSN